MRSILYFLIFSLFVAYPTRAPRAEPLTTKDLQIIARAISFVEGGPSGIVTLGIVFSNDIPQSLTAANQLASTVGDGLKVGSLTLKVIFVPVGELAKLDDAQVVFVTGGLASYYDKIFEATKSRRRLSISSDDACLVSGRCVMGVKSSPKVEIKVSKSAAEASSISFSSSFRMMISEI